MVSRIVICIFFTVLIGPANAETITSMTVIRDYKSGDHKNIDKKTLIAIRTEKVSGRLEMLATIAEDSIYNNHDDPRKLKQHFELISKKSVPISMKKKYRAKIEALDALEKIKNKSDFEIGRDLYSQAMKFRLNAYPPFHRSNAYLDLSRHYLYASYEKTKKNKAESLYYLALVSSLVKPGKERQYLEVFLKKYPKHKLGLKAYQLFEEVVIDSYRMGTNPSELPIEEKKLLEKYRKSVN